MKSLDLFNQYSRHAAWGKNMKSFKSTLGLKKDALTDEDASFDTILESLTSLSSFKAFALIPAHNSSVTHLTAALKEAGIDPALLTKKKVSLLSFILNALGFKKFDEVIDLVIHDGNFIDLKSVMEVDDKSFTNIVFTVLKTIFPPLGGLESIILGALKRF